MAKEHQRRAAFVLIDAQAIKYATSTPGVLSGAQDDQTFGPVLLGELLPPFPAGDWNKRHLAKDPETGSRDFVQTETMRLPGVQEL